MPHKRRQFGDDAEKLAEAYLVSKGYKILHRQFLTRRGEVDLIAKDGEELVFVEVKARHTNRFGYPEESVTDAKLNKIKQTIEAFFQLNELGSQSFRIDVIAIEYAYEPPKINHYLAVE